MKERWYEFVENCKDAVKEMAPIVGGIVLMFAVILSLAFLVSQPKEKKDKPKTYPIPFL